VCAPSACRPTRTDGHLFESCRRSTNLSGGPAGSVCGPLTSFINLVKALRGNALSTSDAGFLLARAAQIGSVAGC
jgi:hypothetical protein